MEVNGPLVSVGVISYNNGRFIIDTLNSINAQSYESVELIIVDDFSTDNSRDLISKWTESSKYPVKVIFNPENLGIAKSCNNFLKNIDPFSKYFCLTGSDDMFLPDRIQKHVEIFENCSSNTAAIFSDAEIINEKGDRLLDSYYKMVGKDYNYYRDLFSGNDNSIILQEIINKNTIPALTVMYRTDIVKLIGGWNEDFFIEDLFLHLKLIKEQYNFFPTKEIIAKHRKHLSSVTTVKHAKYITSLLEIVSGYKGINEKIDASIAKMFKEYALVVYQRNGEKSVQFLKEKYNYDRSFKNFILYKIASLGIPFSRIKPIYNIFSKNATS